MEKQDLISEKIILEELNLSSFKIKSLATLFMKALKLNKVNELYEKNQDKTGINFATSILESLSIHYQCPDEDLKNIPKHEPFIVVANHPLGGIDGLIMLSVIGKARPDFRIMANYLLQQIPQLSDYFVSVNPFGNKSKTGMNMSGIKRSIRLLEEGFPIGIFPAGEVSALKIRKMNVSDKMWNPIVGKMILKSGVKVVPVYFSGKNSVLFNLLGLIHPILRTAKLPSELFNKNKNKITMRIGKPISVATMSAYEDPEQLLRFLRAKTYALGSSLEVSHHFGIRLPLVQKEPHEIIEPTDEALLLSDINNLFPENRLVQQGNLSVYFSGAKHIPHILREISRLREITFREIGEGTNQSCDTDEFDVHYKHLFIWDHQENKLVGAYRIGKGDVLYKRYKKKGFYLNELFKLSSEFTPILKNSLELGRSFIVKEYQKSPHSLLLLWKGISEFIKLQEGKYEYLIGPVSISNRFSKLSKDLLVDFIRKNHFDESLSKLVTPRKRYTYQYKGEAKELKNIVHNDIKLIDGLIADIESSQLKVPVLLKKYLKQNAKIIAFNIDPKFNQSLDGFLVMKIKSIPTDTLEMVE
jgi:putative hemolysin